METSKITSKGRVTIPHALRRAAGLKPGDKLVFRMDGDRIIITRLETAKDFYFGSVSLNLGEWLSDEDEKAWRAL